MFKNRSFNTLVGLTIALLAVLSIGTLAFTHRTPSVAVENRSVALDWYFSHDHAILDGENNVVSEVNHSGALDWYFRHDHAILDGDNNVVSNVNIPTNERYATLKDKQIERLDAVAPAVPASVAPSSAERYATLKDKQLERFESAGGANPD
jgi:hypothetical protein